MLPKNVGKMRGEMQKYGDSGSMCHFIYKSTISSTCRKSGELAAPKVSKKETHPYTTKFRIGKRVEYMDEVTHATY